MVGPASVAITEQIRQACDIVDIVSSYVSLKRAGMQFKGLCPFHREKTPSFQVHAEKQIFKCFGCGVGGDVFKFIQLREGVDFLEARAILAAKAGIQLDRIESSPVNAGVGQLSKTDLERVNRWACRWFQQQLAAPSAHAVQEYLRRRGISDESVRKFALGFAPDGWNALCHAATEQRIPLQLLLKSGLVKEKDASASSMERCYDAFRNRLIFPIRDVMDRTIAFGGRTLGDDPAKYLNSPQTALFDKSRCLYGLQTAKDVFRNDRTAVVVEGYVDCLMAQQHGFGGTVATLGTALTVEHARLLRRYVDTVILVFDSDDAGQRAADHALQLTLSEQLDVKVARVPEAKDPADLLLAAGPEAFRRVLTSACDALEFKWGQVLRRYANDASGPGRRRAMEEFLQLIASSPDFGPQEPIQRGLVLNRVAKLLGLPSEEVYRQLRIVARKAPQTRNTETAEYRPEAPVLPARDAASNAMTELLGVLLDQPTYYASVASVFDPDLIVDGETQEIARVVVQMAQENPEFTVSQVISRFDSVRLANRITSLQASTEARGNHAATVEGAVRCVEQFRARRRVSELEAGLRTTVMETAPGTPSGSESERPTGTTLEEEHLARAHGQGIRQLRQFAARRHLACSPYTEAGGERTKEAGSASDGEGIAKGK